MLGAAHHRVSVGAWAVHTADAGYSAVSSLVADLPSHPVDDRQRVALQTLHALRQRVLRLLTLARWSPHSQTALQLLRVRDVLTQRDAAYHDAATRLMEAHYTVVAEPLYNVPLALQVLSAQTAGGSALVPASVAELRPSPPVAQHPERLDAAVRVRLLRTTRPELLHVAHVSGGLATLRVAHEFEADVTVGPTRTEGDASTSLGGWVVVRVRLLVCDPEAPASSHLGPPQHRMLVWELNKRMAASTEPLCVLHTCMHDLSVTIARDIAGRQAKALAAGRWANAIRLAPLPGVPPPPGGPTLLDATQHAFVPPAGAPVPADAPPPLPYDGWRRAGFDIVYYRNQYARHKVKLPPPVSTDDMDTDAAATAAAASVGTSVPGAAGWGGKSSVIVDPPRASPQYTQTWCLSFPPGVHTVFFAYAAPYSYSDLRRDTVRWEGRALRAGTHAMLPLLRAIAATPPQEGGAGSTAGPPSSSAAAAPEALPPAAAVSATGGALSAHPLSLADADDEAAGGGVAAWGATLAAGAGTVPIREWDALAAEGTSLEGDRVLGAAVVTAMAVMI